MVGREALLVDAPFADLLHGAQAAVGELVGVGAQEMGQDEPRILSAAKLQAVRLEEVAALAIERIVGKEVRPDLASDNSIEEVRVVGGPVAEEVTEPDLWIGTIDVGEVRRGGKTHFAVKSGIGRGGVKVGLLCERRVVQLVQSGK